jgi:hypothetical protein
MDVGSGIYTRQYFSAERYSIFEPSSRSHSVPIIDGEYQFVGRDAAASDVVYEKGRFSMDIAGAYPTDAVKSVKRTFVMDDDKVLMTDLYDMTREATVVERIVTYVKPEIKDDGVIVVGDCRLSWFGNATLKVNTELGAEGECYLIDFTLAAGEKEFKIVME